MSRLKVIKGTIAENAPIIRYRAEKSQYGRLIESLDQIIPEQTVTLCSYLLLGAWWSISINPDAKMAPR